MTDDAHETKHAFIWFNNEIPLVACAFYVSGKISINRFVVIRWHHSTAERKKESQRWGDENYNCVVGTES